MTPIRIAHVVNEPFSGESANGVQQMIYCLARAQAEIGQRVAVFSRDDAAMYVLGPAGAAESRTLQAPSRTSRTTIRHRWLSLYLEQQRAGAVVAWQPDIVHFHSVHIPQNVALAAQLDRTGIAYCVTTHGGLFAPALRRRRFKKRLFKLLFERHYLNAALFVQAVSPHEVGPIRQYGVRAPVIVIPNGVPPGAEMRPCRADALYDDHPALRGQRIFMFIGRLDPWQKGLDLLIEAFARAGLRDAALVLVGPDWFGSQRTLTVLAERLGIASRVVFTGPAFGVDRANLFAAADLFVHPSRWEGLSLSVLAAAAAGKPCLITRAADPLGELERAGVAVVVEANAVSIAAGLRRAAALTSAELQAMGTRTGSVMTRRFNWPAIASTLVEAYRSGEQVRRSGSASEILGRDDPHHG